MKICSIKSGCGREIPLKLFSKDKAAKDGLKNVCKECAKRKHKDWLSKNPGHYKKYDSRRYVRDKDKILERNKRFLRANPNYHQKWYEDNKEVHLARSAQWAKDNPEKVLASVLKRKALKLNQLGYCPDYYWELLIETYGDKCMWPECSKKITSINCLTLDHVLPLSRGGLHDMSNFQILCRSCNAVKGIKIIDFRKEILF